MSSVKSLEIDNFSPLIFCDEDNVTSSKRIIYTELAEDCTQLPSSTVNNYINSTIAYASLSHGDDCECMLLNYFDFFVFFIY